MNNIFFDVLLDFKVNSCYAYFLLMFSSILGSSSIGFYHILLSYILSIPAIITGITATIISIGFFVSLAFHLYVTEKFFILDRDRFMKQNLNKKAGVILSIIYINTLLDSLAYFSASLIVVRLKHQGEQIFVLTSSICLILLIEAILLLLYEIVVMRRNRLRNGTIILFPLLSYNYVVEPV